jgi:hypothetical protein
MFKPSLYDFGNTDGMSFGLTTDERAELTQLRSENRILREEHVGAGQ